MSLRKSTSNFRYVWMTGLVLSGCITCYTIFLNNAKAIRSKMPASIGACITTVQAQVGANVSAGNAQLMLIGSAITGTFTITNL